MARILYELCGGTENALFSPHCWKIRMALAHKGLDFETTAVPFSQVAHIEGGGRRVPVLKDGDVVVEESLAIANYLDATYTAEPTLVGDAALTAFIVNWSNSQLHPAVAKLAMLDIWKGLLPADQDHFRTTREKMLGMTLEEFDAKQAKDGMGLTQVLTPLAMTLKTQPYIGGDTPLFVDYVVFGALQWLRMTASTNVIPADGPVGDWFNGLLDMYDGMGRSFPAAA